MAGDGCGELAEPRGAWRRSSSFIYVPIDSAQRHTGERKCIPPARERNAGAVVRHLSSLSSRIHPTTTFALWAKVSACTSCLRCWCVRFLPREHPCTHTYIYFRSCCCEMSDIWVCRWVGALWTSTPWVCAEKLVLFYSIKTYLHAGRENSKSTWYFWQQEIIHFF